MWPALTAYGSGGDRLAQALEALCEATEANLALVVGLNAQSDGVFHADEGADEPAMTRSVFTEPLERLRRDGMADGTVRSGDAEENATLLCNLVGWTNVHLRTGHRWDPARARRATLDPVVHGLLL